MTAGCVAHIDRPGIKKSRSDPLIAEVTKLVEVKADRSEVGATSGVDPEAGREVTYFWTLTQK